MMDLQALALETTGKLSMLWDSLGISQEEREDFMSNMMEEVKSVYTRRFDEQSLRLKSTEDDIAQLKSEIEFAYKKLKEEAIMVWELFYFFFSLVMHWIFCIYLLFPWCSHNRITLHFCLTALNSKNCEIL